MEKIFTGIDISKDWLDFVVCSQDQQILYGPERVSNDTKGIVKLIDTSSSFAQRNWFCFEHTGNYGLILSSILHAKDLDFTVVPALEIIKSQGMTRGKSDKIDAQRIAIYASISQHKLRKSSIASDTLLSIKSLLNHRQSLVKAQTSVRNSLKSHEIVAKLADMSMIIKQSKKILKQYKSMILDVDKQIKELISSDNQLQENYQLITSVKGIGLQIAAYLLVTTLNFTCFDDPRKYNCYAGTAPFEHSSGSSIHTKSRTSKLRNKQMKTLLFNGANAAIRGDGQLKAYYTKKKTEGKQHQVIINAIACKLIYRAFAVVRRKTPYIVFAQ